MDNKQSRWNNVYRPKSDGGIFGYGLTSEEFKGATATDHLKRAGMFATFGSGAKREDLLNSMGMLTKKQKELAQKGGSDGKIYSKAGPTQPGTKGNYLSRGFTMAIPAASLVGLAATLNSGGDGSDFITDVALPEVGLLAGWRTGKSIGYAAGTKMFGKSVARKAAMGITAGVVGAVTGYAAVAGITSAIKMSTNSNNIINQVASGIKGANFMNDIEVNSNTMSHRRRAADAISKTRMTDRGQALGNEAMIMRGIM